jgi:hypothetical protein
MPALGSRSSLSASECHGLDFESARDATPRLYGVSYGNGNDGVSHTFADFYVRTNDPWRLAELALISDFKSDWKVRAQDAALIDGESDYTISATIYDPLDEECDDSDESYSAANGAWLICEIFPDNDPRDGAAIYDSLADAFSESDLAMVPAN